MKIQKIFLGAIWFLINLIAPIIGLTQVHTSGNVEFHIVGEGSLAAIGEDGLTSNFRFTKSGEAYYLHELSEIWVGDANGNVASAWDLDPTDLGPLEIGEWQAAPTNVAKVDPDERQTIIARYDSSGIAGFPLNIAVGQQSFSWSTNNQPDAGDFVVIRLTVKNNGNETLEGIYVATMANWDVDGTDLATGELSQDWVDWDEAHQTLFTYDGDDTDGLNQVHTGLTLLDGKLNTHQIIPFFDLEKRQILDLFLDEGRSLFMANPDIFTARKDHLEALNLPPWDYVSIISAGPYDIPPNQFIVVTFALVAGENLADLQKNINAAKTVTFTPQRLTAEVVRGTVRLKWGAAINPVVGYTVLRQAGSEDGFRQVGRIITGTTFDDREIQGGVEYTYKIRPVHASEQLLEFDSSAVSISPDHFPDVPTGLAATRDGDQIILGWTKSTRNISRYFIYRNHTGRDPWTRIASVPSGTSTFVDHDGYPGSRYFYAITATNPSGGESQLSQIVDVTLPEETIAAPELNLDKVIFVPNPYRLNGGSHPMEFRNLPDRATIQIYNSTGDLIKQIDHRNNTSIQRWDGRNEVGEQIAPGIYVYHIEALREGQRGKNSVSGKFAVIR